MRNGCEAKGDATHTMKNSFAPHPYNKMETPCRTRFWSLLSNSTAYIAERFHSRLRRKGTPIPPAENRSGGAIRMLSCRFETGGA